MSEIRWGLIQKGSLIALISILTAVALEGWHTVVGVCTGFTRPSVLPVCTHPAGFWLLDFFVVAAAALTIGLSLLFATEVVRIRMRRRASPLTAGISTRAFGSAEWQRILVGLSGMGIIYLTSLSVPLLLPNGFLQLELPDPWWGITFIFLVAAPPAFSVYALLLAIELKTSKAFHPVVTGTGALVGALIGTNLAWTLGLVSALPVVTMIFAYSSYVLGRFTRPSERLSRTGAIWHVVASSGLLIPLAFPFQEISVMVISLYVLLLTAIAVGYLLPHEARPPSD